MVAYTIVSRLFRQQEIETGTQSPSGEGDDERSSSSKSTLYIGLAMGFGVILALVIFLCIIWRFCCKMMHGNASGNKIAPSSEDAEERGGSGNGDDDNDDL